MHQVETQVLPSSPEGAMDRADEAVDLLLETGRAPEQILVLTTAEPHPGSSTRSPSGPSATGPNWTRRRTSSTRRRSPAALSGARSWCSRSTAGTRRPSPPRPPRPGNTPPGCCWSAARLSDLLSAAATAQLG
ncbi:hypothetical protein ACFQZC_12055 [Streptacidiphilus monticola]